MQVVKKVLNATTNVTMLSRCQRVRSRLIDGMRSLQKKQNSIQHDAPDAMPEIVFVDLF